MKLHFTQFYQFKCFIYIYIHILTFRLIKLCEMQFHKIET